MKTTAEKLRHVINRSLLESLNIDQYVNLELCKRAAEAEGIDFRDICSEDEERTILDNSMGVALNHFSTNLWEVPSSVYEAARSIYSLSEREVGQFQEAEEVAA